MALVVFSDLHAHNYKQFNEKGSRLDDALAVLDEVFEMAEEQPEGVIFFAGDLYDNQKLLPTIVVNKVVDRLKELFEKYPRVVLYAISGNHDYATKNLYHSKGETALAHLDAIFDNFVLMDNLNCEVVPKVHLYGIPYYEYKEDFEKALLACSLDAKGTEDGRINILMQHQTPSGLDNPNIPIDIDISTELYDEFDIILNGHIHTNNRMLSDKFLNLGNPLHRDLGDEGSEKGVWLLNLERGIVSPNFVSREGRYPEFRRVKVNEGDMFVKSDDDKNFYVVETVIEEKDTDVDEEKFNTSLKAEELVRNFWAAVDGEDEDSLNVALSLIN